MSLARVVTRPHVQKPGSILFYRGLGAVDAGITYNDTGDGITPSNFSSSCCQDLLALTTDSCSAFVQANQGKFGSATPCSSDGIQNLTFPSPYTTGPAPVTAPPSSGLRINIPTDSRFPECDGRVVMSQDDMNQLLTCQSKIANAKTQAQIQSTMQTNAAQFCAAKKVECQNNWFLTKAAADCSTCEIDFSNSTFWLAALGVLAATIVAIKVL